MPQLLVKSYQQWVIANQGRRVRADSSGLVRVCMNGYDFGPCTFGSKANEGQLSFRGAEPSWTRDTGPYMDVRSQRIGLASRAMSKWDRKAM